MGHMVTYFRVIEHECIWKAMYLTPEQYRQYFSFNTLSRRILEDFAYLGRYVDTSSTVLFRLVWATH